MNMTLPHAALLINAALFDSIWEGALIAGLAWLALRCLSQLSAASRYAIWLSTLVALFAIPVLTTLVSGQVAPPKVALTALALSQPIHPASVRRVIAGPGSQSQRIALAAVVLPARSERLATARTARKVVMPQALAVAIALIWALVAVARGLRLAMNLRDIALIRRDSRLWSAAYEFPVYVSDAVGVPIAIGFSQPAVILPALIFELVDASALEAILIHEMAHLRRCDVWTNAFAQVIEAFLALNPVSWFVASRISSEREMACDDWVVSRSDSTEAFTRALTLMASRISARLPVLAPSALGSRRAMLARIEQLMDEARPRDLHLSAPALSGAAALLTLAAFGLQAMSPALAFAPRSSLTAHRSAITATSSCTQRDRGPVLHHTYGPGGPRMNSESLSDGFLQKLVQKHPATTTTYDVKVDASGRPHDLTILHRSKDPAVDQRVIHTVLSSTFEPAHHDCGPLASTFRSGLTRLPSPSVLVIVNRETVVSNGAKATTGKAECSAPHRNPSIVNLARPKFPDWIKWLAAQRSFVNAVRIRVNAAGTVTSATAASSVKQLAFDDATVAAAKRSTYAPGLVNCAPTPSEYVVRWAFTQWLEP
ncbi:MAG: hypothetical protein GIW99_05645 [Candidatus Eremiobacteraeota bacterium]|nr:hypothetical protein [Candidatus Eremiobacteraeota bacterium]MBC5827151.1 hypothetical protein [Candidatus Eremiobacteraeota bacterium]